MKKGIDDKVDNFVRSMKVCLIDEYNIKIKSKEYRAKTFHYSNLEFRLSSDEWKTFRHILADPLHTLYIGPSTDPAYYARRNTLKRINTKIIAKLNDEFDEEIPKSYKLYEKSKHCGKGTYHFKFIVTNPPVLFQEQNHIKEKKELLNNIETLKEKLSSEDKMLSKNIQTREEIVAIIREGYSNRILTQQEVDNLQMQMLK